MLVLKVCATTPDLFCFLILYVSVGALPVYICAADARIWRYRQSLATVWMLEIEPETYRRAAVEPFFQP